MKIAVITLFDSANYGAYLQGYCLKKVLEDMGHNVVHIKTRDEKYIRNLFYRSHPCSVGEKLRPWVFNSRKRFGTEKYQVFKEAWSCFNVVDIHVCDADLYILGSDEIWNFTKPVLQNKLFWGGGMSPVIAYAPSIAGARVEDFEKHEELINCLRNIKKVLARDENTLKLTRMYSKTTCELVCDPTILVPIDEYYAEYNDEFLTKNRYLLVYAYNIDKKTIKIIKAYAKKYRLKTVACCFKHDWCDYIVNCGPLHFSSLIRKSAAVFTTTFHGSIFCMLNHANFVSVGRSPKTVFLLRQYGLSDRMLDKDNVTLEGIERVLNNLTTDYDAMDKRVEELRSTSKELLADAIEASVNSSKNEFEYPICSVDDCTGCFACMNICPKNAIECIEDGQGRTLPRIDQDKCIKCGMCKKVCPQNYPVEKKKSIACYAAQRTDPYAREQSSSGGIAAVMSEYVIRNNGVVFGAAVDQDGIVKHMPADTMDKTESFKKSKYVQSYTGFSYREAEDYLKQGRLVLYTGTPCQIAGFRKYLKKGYDNLLCVDIICHGTPPMKYLRQHLNTVAGTSDVDSISFRGGKSDFILSVRKNNKVLYEKDKLHDKYFHAFLKCLTYRENCYRCKYAVQERIGDITIGDFWGIDRKSLSGNFQGRISVVLVNTEQGEKLFEKIKGCLVFEGREAAEAVSGNPQLRGAAIKHSQRDKFIKSYIAREAFDEALMQSGIIKEMAIMNVKLSYPWQLISKTKKIIKKKLK